MKTYPIIFSAPMVLALLDGRKTQTRRFANSPRRPGEITGKEWRAFSDAMRAEHLQATEWLRRYERWQAGERDMWLWVRETWATVNSECGPGWAYKANGEFQQPEYDGEDFGAGPSFNYDKYPGQYSMWYGDLVRGEPDHRWTPSIHMPRRASRLSLRVTDMRRERLQDISDTDARAEGAELVDEVTGRISLDDRRGSYRDGFWALWDLIHGPGSWDANPEVVVLSFVCHHGNIDDVKA